MKDLKYILGRLWIHSDVFIDIKKAPSVKRGAFFMVLIKTIKIDSWLSRLEQGPFKVEVMGSRPIGSTKRKDKPMGGGHTLEKCSEITTRVGLC